MPDTNPITGIEDGHALAQAIVDTIREPLLVLDKDLRVVAASRSFYLMFKANRQEVQGLPIYSLGNGQWNIPELRLLLEQILPRHSVMEAYEVEHEFSTIGRRVMLLNARTVVAAGDPNSLILLSIEDITDRRVTERRLADLLKQKETLLQEMQHRVANSLQIIASILLIKARTVESDETRLHLQDAHRRVLSVASVQQHLQASRHGERIPMAPYLTQLCDTLGASMIGDNRPIEFKVQVGGGEASSNEAVSIGLIVTELVINALKHAFVVLILDRAARHDDDLWRAQHVAQLVYDGSLDLRCREPECRVRRHCWHPTPTRCERHPSTTLLPWTRKIEAAFAQTALSTGYRLHFDVDSLLKADINDLYSALLKGRQGGWLSPNDCRSETGFAAVVGGDDIEPPVAGGKPAEASDDEPPPKPASPPDDEADKIARLDERRSRYSGDE